MIRGVVLVCAALTATLLPERVGAAPVRMRFPEGPAHGFIALSDAASGTVLAHGEVIQSLEGRTVASRLVIRFDDGSLHDETVHFTQRPVFRVVSYHLVQEGPSFMERIEVTFDRTGHYRVRRRAKPGAQLEEATGHFDVPDDMSNGMTSTLLKNLMPKNSATTHVVRFRPEPVVLEYRLEPEGTDRFWVGRASGEATRFVIRPEATGLTGVLATLAGKQPPPFRMWIARGAAPTLVRFEGPLYVDGPTWRIEITGPRWKE
jgi:hypothetical protein